MPAVRKRLNPCFYGTRIGTPGWIRTSGFQLRRLTLYPLSYGRIKDKSEVGMRKVETTDEPLTPHRGFFSLWVQFWLDYYPAKFEPNLIHKLG